MEKKTDLRSKWVVITAGTNIFDAEFRAGALELAHEHGFHNIRLRIDGEILKRDYLKSELFRSGNGGIIPGLPLCGWDAYVSDRRYGPLQ